MNISSTDEAHYINNKAAKTNKAATKLIAPRTKRHRKGYNKGIPYICLVSGTPITSYPEQLFGLLRIGNDQLLGNWKVFKEKYLVFNEYGDIIGYQNLNQLEKKVKGILIRRTDKEIEMSLPKMIEQDIYVDPTPKQLKLDKELIEYQKDLIKQKMELLRQRKKMEAEAIGKKITSVLAFRRMASNHPNCFQMSSKEHVREKYAAYKIKNDMEIPKFERCIELVKEIVDNGHKVVIFTESRVMTGILHKHIKQFTKAIRYIGGLSDKVRERRKEKFNTDPSCKVMIANAAGSTGLNLQAGRYLINYDLPDTPAIWEQRKYRIRRLDSTHDRVHIINLINKDMVDEQVYTKLVDKQNAFNATIENDDATTKEHLKMTKKKELKDDDIF